MARGEALLRGMRDAGIAPLACLITTLRATPAADLSIYDEARVLHPIDPRENRTMAADAVLAGNTLYATISDGGLSGYAAMVEPDFENGTMRVIAGPVLVSRRGARCLAAFVVPDDYEGSPWAHFTRDEAGAEDVAMFPLLVSPAPEAPPVGSTFVIPAVTINNHVGDKGV